jgi:hypothetical protein
MQSLPWEASPPLANVNTQIPKDGSQLWAKVFSTSSEYPLVTYWELGEGASMCFASKFPNGVKPWARGWAYFPQAMVYLVYRTSGKELPADPLLFAGVIESLEQHSERSSTVDSIFAFVERFGGNLNRLYARVDEISLQKAEADRVYLEGDYSLCQEVLGEVAAMQMEVMEEALKAKDAALFWVYVTEWCAMTGTMLISGVILWTLMVKRRLYREVGISRQAGDRLG